MEIRIRADGALVTEQEFRALFPNTSMPTLLSEQDINDLGADVVFEGPRPSPTLYQTAYRNGVEEIGGKWYTKYSVADMDTDAITMLNDQLKAANSDQASLLLLNTDWCENSSVRDTSVTPHLINYAEFDAYRLSLRAIAVNPPVTVDIWPTRPTTNWST